MNKNWKDTEFLVELIEKSLSPGAKVFRDKQMPVIGSNRRTRQCDVVVISGEKPRETIWIIEVQDRNSKTNIGTFDGWVRKLDQIGGQHLICVSTHDFPSSIVEEAGKLGGKVKLISIKNADTIDSIVVSHFLNNQLKILDGTFKVKKFIDLRIGSSQPMMKNKVRNVLQKKFGISDIKQKTIHDCRCFSFDKQTFLSLYLLCRDYSDLKVVEHPFEDDGGICEIKFQNNNHKQLYMFDEGVYYEIQLQVKFKWSRSWILRPTSVLSYEQIEDGILAWIARCQYEEPNGRVEIQMPIAVKDGKVKINGAVSNVPEYTKINAIIVDKKDALKNRAVSEFEIFGDNKGKLN